MFRASPAQLAHSVTQHCSAEPAPVLISLLNALPSAFVAPNHPLRRTAHFRWSAGATPLRRAASDPNHGLQRSPRANKFGKPAPLFRHESGSNLSLLLLVMLFSPCADTYASAAPPNNRLLPRFDFAGTPDRIFTEQHYSSPVAQSLSSRHASVGVRWNSAVSKNRTSIFFPCFFIPCSSSST